MNKLHLSFLLLLMGATTAIGQRLTIGKTVSNVTITNANDDAKPLPYYGEKLLMVLYTDPDVKDVNDPLSNAVKTKGFDKQLYQGIGVANCKDTWIPNSGIRMKARQKERDFPGSIVMIDADHTMAKAWGLTNCNETGYVVIIGKDKALKYIKQVKSQEESKAITNEVITVIERELGVK